jgi:3'-phosphoadenosine 5'-phosphosulfate sulfotransferase (PAPS reductase)/FAD synthetase
MIVSWWSGGIASAVTCNICIQEFGAENVRLIFIDTRNEHPDTYRFKRDCENWYGKEIDVLTNPDYTDIRDVWRKYKSLNVATGAICSTILKRRVREMWEKSNVWDAQAFGFDSGELRRAKGMMLNYSDIKPIFPLIEKGISKENATSMLFQAGLKVPEMYRLGFENNNCFGTGCVQGGIGYWQKIGREMPEKFAAMAEMEHELTDIKGEPVTMLKDQSKGGGKVFLLPHPSYPDIKHIGQMKGREPKSLLECNGFCGANDLEIDLFDDINLEGAE